MGASLLALAKSILVLKASLSKYIAAKNGLFQSLTVFQLHPKLKSTRILGLLRGQ